MQRKYKWLFCAVVHHPHWLAWPLLPGILRYGQNTRYTGKMVATQGVIDPLLHKAHVVARRARALYHPDARHYGLSDIQVCRVANIFSTMPHSLGSVECQQSKNG
jgi:hypothetical protein